MAFEFKLPDIGEGIHEGEIAKWLVAEGDKISEDDVLVEIQNDKAVVEIPSPVDGTISKIHVEEGEVTTVGTTIVTIDDGSEDTASEEAAEPTEKTDSKQEDDAAKPADEKEASEAEFLTWYRSQDQPKYEKPSVTVDMVLMCYNKRKKKHQLTVIKLL